jgi:ubiquinone/menaquinone biosynthesis C-methylase UbiE
MRRDDVPEHGDRPMAPSDLEPYLDDLDRLNRWFGGYWLTVRAVRRLLPWVPPSRAARVADVGGARGDLAIRLVRDARRRRRAVTVVVFDRDEATLFLGLRATKPYPEVRFVQADAAALPLRAGGVDVAVTSLTLHHLSPGSAVEALVALRVAARSGVVVNDLIRSRVSTALVWLVTRLFARHPFSLDDGPRSVRRAYSAIELSALARRAGFARFRVRPHRLLARLIAVGS